MTIEDLIAYETQMTVFKSLNDFGPQCMYEMLSKTSQVTECSLPNTATDLRLPLRKSAIGQKSFSYRGAKMWNSLSTECKEAPSLWGFGVLNRLKRNISIYDVYIWSTFKTLHICFLFLCFVTIITYLYFRKEGPSKTSFAEG